MYVTVHVHGCMIKNRCSTSIDFVLLHYCSQTALMFISHELTVIYIPNIKLHIISRKCKQWCKQHCFSPICTCIKNTIFAKNVYPCIYSAHRMVSGLLAVPLSKLYSQSSIGSMNNQWQTSATIKNTLKEDLVRVGCS